MKYDVFVSHATKDKLGYVDKLVDSIKKEGLEAFYYQESVTWGDSISKTIATALQNSTLAVVVISKHFFNRQWTEYELRTLLARQEQEGEKLIMPILHRITKKQLTDKYPELSDILFKYSKSCKCEEMAKILKQEVDKKKR